MPLEASVTNIADLDPASPTGAEGKAQGDDHIRNLKKALKNAFPGFAGSVLVAGTNGGLVNAYTLTPTVPLPAYTAMLGVLFTPAIANTGAVTLNISGLGVKAVVSVNGAALVSGDLPANQPAYAIYDGASFRLASITKRYMDALVISNTLPGVGDVANAGKYYKTDGVTGSWASIDGRGDPALDKGNSGTTAQVVDYANGDGQTLTVTGAFNLSPTGFPAGRLAGVLLRVINGGSASWTTSGITWIKSDNTLTTNFLTSGITLQSAGTNMLLLFSYGDGTIYGKAA